ncbi:hypothetical protein HHS_01940 [Candidatus Pantoea carbekii]|uniref:Uncharacterized protein n=1 Tax=Candidatus Pantoea carbekii TaxID=1235990 RepID=U3U7F0_9GAMM|nr:hypothetical protein HHS_01940 [Candidatus Pantoea carbekii]
MNLNIMILSKYSKEFGVHAIINMLHGILVTSSKHDDVYIAIKNVMNIPNKITTKVHYKYKSR